MTHLTDAYFTCFVS